MLEKIRFLFLSSLTCHIYTAFREKILRHPIYLFLTDFSYVLGLYKKSRFYTLANMAVQYLSGDVQKTQTDCLYGLTALLTLLPLFLTDSILSRGQYFLILLILLLLKLRCSPHAAVKTDASVLLTLFVSPLALRYFVSAAMLSVISDFLCCAVCGFIILSGLKSEKRLLLLIGAVFAVLLFSWIGMFGDETSSPDDYDVVSALILLSPLLLAFLFRLRTHFMPGRNGAWHSAFFFSLYSMMILAVPAFSVADLGISAYAALLTSILLFTAAISLRTFILLCIMLPAAVVFALYSLFDTFTVFPENGSFLEGIVYTAANFWSRGVGINIREFSGLYASAAIKKEAAYPLVSPEISITYNDIFIPAGIAALTAVLWYNVRLIRLALTLLFKKDFEYRTYIAACLSGLVGASLYGILSPAAPTLSRMLPYAVILAVLSFTVAAKRNEKSKTQNQKLGMTVSVRNIHKQT